MAKWQYEVQELDAHPSPNRDGALDRRGVAGWELVTVVVSYNQHYAYFKRPVSDESKPSK